MPAPARPVPPLAAVFHLTDRLFWPLAALAFLIGLARNRADVVARGEWIDLAWKLAQFNVSYTDFGFLKRGLVGSLLHPVFGVMPDPTAQKWAVLAIDAALLVAFLMLARRAIAALEWRAPEWGGWLRVLLLLSPLGVMQWGYDLGRLDHVNALLLLAALALLLRGHALACGLVMAAAVLVHEGALFYALPAVLAAGVLVSAGRGLPATWALAAGPAVAAGLLVLAFGNVTDPALIAALDSLGPGASVWQRAVLEPAGDLSTKNLGLMGLYLAGLAVVFLPPLAALYGWGVAALVMALPLCLFVLGIDYFRWIHLTGLLAATALVAGALHRPDIRLPTLRPLPRLALICLALPLGPIGITLGLPVVQRTLF
ncbi:MAG TPA: hypothetical protein VLA78_01105 [Paracoccaceae bacterium]|nr:hypothetical protein [Paracoccaceae bacterium]